MNSLNSILLEGRLVSDGELSYTPKGTAVYKFSIACERFLREGESDEPKREVSFFDVTTWQRLAEVCAEYLKKGRGVRVVGRLKQDRWTDEQGGARSRVHIVAEHVEFKPSRNGEKESANAPEGEARQEPKREQQ